MDRYGGKLFLCISVGCTFFFGFLSTVSTLFGAWTWWTVVDGVDNLEERDVFGGLRGVHAVHCGHCVFAVYRGQGRGSGNYLSYEGFADTEGGCYVAVGFAFFD